VTRSSPEKAWGGRAGGTRVIQTRAAEPYNREHTAASANFANTQVCASTTSPIAVAAAKLGDVDDVLYDYIRRPTAT
jgi:hypothetical protein